MYCPDNLDMFNAYSARQEEMLSKMPQCSDCGDFIQAEHLFNVNGDLFCFDCMKANFERETEDYTRE